MLSNRNKMEFSCEFISLGTIFRLTLPVRRRGVPVALRPVGEAISIRSPCMGMFSPVFFKFDEGGEALRLVYTKA